MKLSNQRLEEIVVDTGFISEKDFNFALELEKKNQLSLEVNLVKGGFISDENLGQLIASEMGVKFIDLRKEGIDEKLLPLIPEKVAKEQLAVFFDKSKNGLQLAMNSPDDLEFISLLKKKTGQPIEVYFATEEDLNLAFDIYRAGIQEKINQLMENAGVDLKRDTVGKNFPVIEIVDTLLEYAYKNKASDIHIEPLKKKLHIRFRIDGVLHAVLELPEEILEPIITRVKVLSKLRTDDHFSAQDGKIHRQFNGDEIDIRVSIVPIVNGEKGVLRLLSERTREFTLDSLGFHEEDFKKVSKAIKKPWGMILATGPTGSGKTTTLYSILKILNKPEINIATIEDPVEYDIETVNQIQVNPRTNLTFAKGLKSIIRQDPDIIMIGEIRDEETAGIAVNAAMTGHLVLSTLHTNDAATTLPRLLDMHIEPFLIASTVNVAIAQRLVRKICHKCRASRKLTVKETAQIKNQLNSNVKKLVSHYSKNKRLTIYEGKGCKACQRTGYSGRIGIFEVLEVGEDIKSFIMRRANAGEIRERAIKKGMNTMLEDGMRKVIEGITTIEEVLRVTRG